jgi:prevent-host-death family protein
MKVTSLADVKARLSAYIEELSTKGPVVITRNGRTAAILLAPDDDDDLERLLMSRSPQMRALATKPTTHKKIPEKIKTKPESRKPAAKRARLRKGG